MGTCKEEGLFLAGFDGALRALLKASPERRPGQAVVEARRADYSSSDREFMNNPG
jgi:hypothetical protein